MCLSQWVCPLYYRTMLRKWAPQDAWIAGRQTWRQTRFILDVGNGETAAGCQTEEVWSTVWCNSGGWWWSPDWVDWIHCVAYQAVKYINSQVQTPAHPKEFSSKYEGCKPNVFWTAINIWSYKRKNKASGVTSCQSKFGVGCAGNIPKSLHGGK